MILFWMECLILIRISCYLYKKKLNDLNVTVKANTEPKKYHLVLIWTGNGFILLVQSF